jgi:hypothetical protein
MNTDGGRYSLNIRRATPLIPLNNCNLRIHGSWGPRAITSYNIVELSFARARAHMQVHHHRGKNVQYQTHKTTAPLASTRIITFADDDVTDERGNQSDSKKVASHSATSPGRIVLTGLMYVRKFGNNFEVHNGPDKQSSQCRPSPLLAPVPGESKALPCNNDSIDFGCCNAAKACVDHKMKRPGDGILEVEINDRSFLLRTYVWPSNNMTSRVSRYTVACQYRAA